MPHGNLPKYLGGFVVRGSQLLQAKMSKSTSVWSWPRRESPFRFIIQQWSCRRYYIGVMEETRLQTFWAILLTVTLFLIMYWLQWFTYFLTYSMEQSPSWEA